MMSRWVCARNTLTAHVSVESMQSCFYSPPGGSIEISGPLGLLVQTIHLQHVSSSRCLACNRLDLSLTPRRWVRVSRLIKRQIYLFRSMERSKGVISSGVKNGVAHPLCSSPALCLQAGMAACSWKIMWITARSIFLGPLALPPYKWLQPMGVFLKQNGREQSKKIPTKDEQDLTLPPKKQWP